MNFSVLIVPVGASAAFKPDLAGAQPGQPLGVLLGDNVTWNNTTDFEHQPWPTNGAGGALLPEAQARADGVYLSDPVAPGSPSAPTFNVKPTNTSQTTIFYGCAKHPTDATERSSIVITS